MIEGSCHCGAVHWTFRGVPEAATACNCTVCRRYGVLWAYDYEDERIRVSGPTRAYVWGNGGIGFHFCRQCGCVAYWRSNEAGPDGRRRIAEHFKSLGFLFVALDLEGYRTGSLNRALGDIGIQY